MLLDSHYLLWFLAGDRSRIGEALRERIEREPALVSVASLWEIAIKLELGKLDAPDDLPAGVGEAGFEVLPIRPEHAWAVRALPSHHRDPFDRLLIAQAQVEREPVLSADPVFAAYEVELVAP